MLVKYHVIVGLIASLLIWFIFPSIGWFYALIIFLASFLIDFDHYLWYGFTKKDWSLTNAVKFLHNERALFFSLKTKDRAELKSIIMIFHGVECWLLVLLLIFVHKLFLFVLIGIGIHMVLDFTELYRNKRPLYIKISQIYAHHRNNQNGVQPRKL